MSFFLIREILLEIAKLDLIVRVMYYKLGRCLG